MLNVAVVNRFSPGIHIQYVLKNRIHGPMKQVHKFSEQCYIAVLE